MVTKLRKNKKSYTILDTYNTFKKIRKDVEYSRYKRILDTFNKVVSDEIFERSRCFKMPFGLGYICVVKYKPRSYTPKSLSVDYKASK